MGPQTEDKRFSLALLAIVAAGFLIRAAGIGFGLPNLYHQDEPMMVHHALAIGVADLPLHPGYFVIPAFVIYLLFTLYSVSYVLGHFAGTFADPQAFALKFLEDPSAFFLMGRFVIGVMFGAASVGLLGKMAKDLFGPRTGLLAALFLAFAFLHVHESRYIYADVPMTFFLIAFYVVACRCLRNPVSNLAVLAGACLGLAMAAKYNAVIAAAPVFVVGLLDREITLQKKTVLFLIAGLTAALMFFLINPYVILDWPSFVDTWRRQSRAQAFMGYGYHLEYSLAGGLGWPLLGLSLAGFIPFIRKYRREGLFAAGFVLLHYVICIYLSQPYARYMLPAVPFLCLSAAFGLEAAAKAVPAFLLCLLVLAQPLAMDAYSVYLLHQEDTRTELQRWIEAQIPANTKIALDHSFFGPHLFQKEVVAGSPIKKELYGETVQWKTTYDVYYIAPESVRGTSFAQPSIPADLETLREEGIRYAVFNFQDMGVPMQRLYETVRQSGKLIASVSPYRNASRKRPLDWASLTADPLLASELFRRKRPGPYLELYELPS